MSLGEYLPNSNTKLLLHLNGSSADSSGNGNNGTDTAITYSQANGKFGQGAGFNGSTSFISIPHNSSYCSTTATWRIWYKPGTLSNPPTGYSIISKQGPNNRNGVYILQGNGGGCYAQLFDSVGTAGFIGLGGLISGQHNLITITFTSGGTYQGFMNGKLIDSGSGLPTFTFSSSNPLTIGKNSDTFWNFMPNGSCVDEVIFLDKVVTPQEEKKYYTNAKGRFGII